MKQALSLLVSLFFITTTNTVVGSVVKLDVDTVDTLTAGKTVFIKFFAPWCGHCKSMAPAWEQLAEEWADSATGMIAEVDCTEPTGQPLCEEYGVEGFPTLMYGDINAPETYEGGRDYESLSEFAKEHLTKVYCSVRNVETCTDEEKAIIAELRSKSKEELDAIVEVAATRLTEASDKYEKEIEELQATFERVTDEHKDENEAIRKETNIKFVNQVLAIDHPETAEDGVEDEL